MESIQFRNGATLKFISGGGSDKSRAGFTARVVVITETDGMDKSSDTSREADKITQLDARTRAYGNRKRVYMECTVSTEKGRTWREYQGGTKSRIVLPCPHCEAWVTPEREHFFGWQDAESQAAARRLGAFACPQCGQLWTDEARVAANQANCLLHDGQTIDEQGQVHGEPPATDTLGFRWSAVNNLFLSSDDFAADEWRAARNADEENAEREMRQFVWCLPVFPAKLDETAIKLHELASRVANVPRGTVPDTAQHLTVGVDLGKYLAHYVAVAWSENATGHVVDYGRVEVPTADFGVEKALLIALHQLQEVAGTGWAVANADGNCKLPDQVWIDVGYMSPVVYTFCRSAGERYTPSKGFGAGQQGQPSYHRPTSHGSITRYIGEEYHLNRLQVEKLLLAETNADHWKTFVHQRLSTPLANPGAMTLFQATPNEHLSFAKHLTAEVKTEEFVHGKGVVIKWERKQKNNQWFDALYSDCAAAHSAAYGWLKKRRSRTTANPAADGSVGESADGEGIGGADKKSSESAGSDSADG